MSFKTILNTRTYLIQTCQMILDSNLNISDQLKKLLKAIIIRENLSYLVLSASFTMIHTEPYKLPDGTTINANTPNTLEYAISLVDILPKDDELLKTPDIFKDRNGKPMRSFHNPIKLSDVFTDKRKEYIYTTQQRMGLIDMEPIITIADLHDKLIYLADLHDEKIDLFDTVYVPDKKHTNRKTLIASDKTRFSNGVHLERPLREIMGRLRKTLIPSMHAEARIIGKIGLLNYVDENTWLQDPDTSAIVLCMAAESTNARAFTLDSAERGAFSPSVHILLQYLANRSQTNWNLLACIHPSHINDASVLHAKWINQTCLKLLRQFAYVLNYLWNTGIKECAQRNMLIPRSSTGINSSAWNAIADAWNNVLRFMRSVNRVLGKPQVPAYKVMRVVAGDLRQWVEREMLQLESLDTHRNEVQQKRYEHLKHNANDVAVFADLSANNHKPWDAILVKPYHGNEDAIYQSSESDILIKAVTETCKKHNFPIGAYLGAVNAVKTSEHRVYRTMICGVEVFQSDGNNLTNADKDTLNVLKSLGVAGAREWTGN